MARYTPIGNHDEYEQGIDVGYDDYVPPRTPASARKYVTVERPVTNPTTTLRKASQSAPTTRSRRTVDYNAQVEVAQTRGNDVLYTSTYARPSRRPVTDEDPEVTTRLREVKHSRHGISRRGIFTWGAALVGSIVVTKLGMNTVNDIQDAMLEGQQPSTGIALVCGHGDSSANPTLLHAYVQGQRVNLVELPGGDERKAKFSQSIVIASTVAVDKWHLDLVPQLADGGHYQLMLSLKIVGDSVVRQWLYVDAGGYFRQVTK